MKQTFTIHREAMCVLETTVEVEIGPGGIEHAREKAIGEAESITDPARFTVISKDLTSVEGSSEIVE